MSALVGRDTEMARLRALLDDAAAGRAVTALVGGDAGVGKSRLVAEVMAPCCSCWKTCTGRMRQPAFC